MHRIPLILIAALFVTGVAQAQVVNPEGRRRFEQVMAERYRLVEQADAAWDREMAREKTGDCLSVSAQTQMDTNECFARAAEMTRANLKAYVAAFRAIFALRDDNERITGPSGTPPTRDEFLKAFDDTEAKWNAYESEMCNTAYSYWLGGSIAPSEFSVCELHLMRSHMRELGAILGWSFHM